MTRSTGNPSAFFEIPVRTNKRRVVTRDGGSHDFDHSRDTIQRLGTHFLSNAYNDEVSNPSPPPPRNQRPTTAAFLSSQISLYPDHLLSLNHAYEFQSAAMSLAYENRGFAEYPQSTIMDDPTAHDHLHHQQRYPSPPAQMTSDDPFTQIESALELRIQELPPQKDDNEESGSSPRPITLAKPNREVMKDEDGRYVCTWSACPEAVRTFNRKCEWNKHMDKHDRPYKCQMEGCEKIPGFTYSGGLLRHQREVHNLHGGPKKQLNCPHVNCKRNTGKGFSRQENLNEHLRRVHTATIDSEMQNNGEEPDEDLAHAGTKRKRVEDHSEVINGNAQNQQQPDMARDMARVIHENKTLRQQVEIQSGQIQELMRQLNEVQAMLNPRAPQAMM